MWQKPKKTLSKKNEALEYALNLLDVHEHSERGLRQKLQRRLEKPELVEDTVQQLKDYKLLDDERYARMVFTAWRRKKVYGRLHLQAELQKKLVSEQYIPLLLKELTEEEEAERAEAAYALTQKRRDGKYTCTTEKGVGALVRFLTARGFSPGAIHHVLALARKQVQEEDALQ